VQGSVGSELRIFLLANHNISQEMNNIRLLGRTPRPSNWLGKCRHFLLPHSVVIRIFISALLVLSMDRRAIIRKDLPCPPLRPLRGQVPQMVGKAEVPWGLRQVLPGRRPPSPPQVEGWAGIEDVLKRDEYEGDQEFWESPWAPCSPGLNATVRKGLLS